MSRRARRALIVGAAVMAAAPVVSVAIVFTSGDSGSSGAAGRDSVLTEPSPQPITPPPPAEPTGDPAAGRELFLARGCGNCHTLAAAGTTGTIGPVLDTRTPRHEDFLRQVTSGGGGMPSYEGVLTPREIEDVVAFVLDAIER